MTPERWQQVEEIFQAAVDLAPAERERYVSQACAGDASLRRDVETLLIQHDSASGVLEHPVYGSTELSAIESFIYDDDEDPMLGRRLGAYRIEREVGRGGMGAVYEALRVDNEFTLRVAIKLVKRGMDTDFILRRFRKERQILAALDHPYIARLLDGGTTDDGLPYFVMEFIEGQPLYRYCDAHNLSIGERLRLFIGVCDAVHYAHQKQVIHRDIKPSNVLVTSEGIPKLLDFGIAKLLNPELAAEITHDPTATAMRLMTPEYASPEQVQGAPTTPSTDVYSLGVLLYELLTGHRPYRLVNRAPFEIARVICEEQPTLPSVIITRAEDLLPHLAAGDDVTTLKQLFATRSASVESLRRELSGDLDTIMMRALRKEPEWRYQTAEQLRDDIARYLEGVAVSELPDQPRGRNAHIEPIQTENSLAVLPLKLFDTGAGSDSGPDYLGTGLADVLITRLSAIRRFAVRPTSSVLRYGAETDPLLAGRELGVAFVLDGRLRRAGDRIRVTVQLLSVRDGTAMWAEQFDEKFTDVLSLEDAISSRVAEAIVPHLSGDDRIRLAKRGTDDPQAHEAYLRGRYYWNTFTEEGFAKAVVCYHQAIAVDPHYAVAYAGIAEYYNWLGIFGVLPHSDCSAAAYEAAATAVSIDPVLAEGHGALGQAILCRDFDWERAEQQLLRSIELNPNYSEARVWYAFQLAMEGRFAESLREARIARELDPMAVLSGLCLGFCTYQSRSFAEALAFCENTLKGEPHNAMLLFCSSFALSQLGRHRESIVRATQGLEMIGRASHTLGRLGAAYAAGGDAARAEMILSEMGEVAQHRYISPYHLALVHCGLGRKERALDLLETAYETKDAWIVWMAVDPELDSVRNDARFAQLLRNLNHRLADAPAIPAALAHSESTQSKTGVVSEADDQSRVTSPLSPAPDTLPSDNEEARQLYAAGRYYATRRTAEGLKQAIPRLERAVELDPKFALAYAELADCYSLLNWYVEPAPAEAWPQARKAATNAVDADPGLAEAHAALGFVRLHYDRDWIDAEREFKKAIQLKPNALVSHRWYAYSLSAMGRHVEALAEMQRAREISPQSAIIASGVANVLFLAGRFDEAIDACRKALELDPGGVAAHTVLRWSYERKGMHAEALAAFEQERVFAGDTPTTRAKRAHVLAATGNTEEASQILEELLARRPKEWVTAYEIAVIYCLLGNNDNAFTWLEQAEREHAVGFTFARVDPNLESLRSDPRFAELMSSSSKTVTQPEAPGAMENSLAENAQRTQTAQLK